MPWEIGIPADTVLYTDGSLLRQVIVNIIKNAAEAGAKNIECTWRDSALRISNDGTPIPAEVRRDIFISNLPLSIYVYAFIILRMGQPLPIPLISALRTIFLPFLFVITHRPFLRPPSRESMPLDCRSAISFFIVLCVTGSFSEIFWKSFGKSFGKSFRKSLSFFPSFLPPSSSSFPIETR